MGGWVMFPDPVEQGSLQAMPVDRLYPALKKSAGGKLSLVVSAAYDLFYAVNDQDKARKLLELGIADVGLGVLTDEVHIILLFVTMVDGHPKEAQQKFIDFCATLGIKTSAEPPDNMIVIHI